MLSAVTTIWRESARWTRFLASLQKVVAPIGRPPTSWNVFAPMSHPAQRSPRIQAARRRS